MAATVTVRFYALLRLRLNMACMQLEAGGLTIGESLRLAEKQAGQPFLGELLDERTGLLAGTIVLLNGENVRLKQNLETRVRAGDTIDLFSPAGGG